MDKIHEIDSKLWINTRIINLKELIGQRNIELKSNSVLLDKDEVETSDSNEKLLLDQLNKFVESTEYNIKPYFLFNSTDEKSLIRDENCKLKTYELQLEHARRMISDRAYKVNYLMNLQTTRGELLMRHLALTNRPTASSDSDTVNSQPCDQDDKSIRTILVVQIWPQPSKKNRIKLEKEILFKSDNCLTDLRDQFKCQRDYGVPVDLSEDPEQGDRIFRGELFKSGFFLIGSTFYNDMRDPNNTDLSASIIDWAAKGVTVIGENGENIRVSRGLGPFESTTMESSRFEDLKFKLGCPYLYLHQGDCEHLFTISDINYWANDDEDLIKTKFPFVRAISIGRKQDNLRCYMCKSRPPHWYTRNNTRLPVDPYFFCENCFYSFNYDNNKKKVGQFQAYLYTSAFGIPDSVVMVGDN